MNTEEHQDSMDSSVGTGEFSYDDDGCTITKSTVSPRKGGPKEYRLARSKILDTIPMPAPPRTAILSTYSEDEVILPRLGGPKEARLYRVRMMDTGRYVEAAIQRGEKIEDVDLMHSIRVDNLFKTSEDTIRKEFEVYGRLGDVYRPIDKNKMKPELHVFVRFIFEKDMMHAFEGLQGKVVDGRPMILTVSTDSGYELDTSIY